VRDLLTYAARLAPDGSRPADDRSDAEYLDGAEDRKARARNGFGRNAVQKAYNGGVSEYWRPFLEMLADRGGEWVAWSTLYEGLGLTSRQAAGMLGAAERRCKGHPPYEKAWEEYEHWFRMPTETAEIVKELAARDSE
jgi:hypothetical protein